MAAPYGELNFGWQDNYSQYGTGTERTTADGTHWLWDTGQLIYWAVVNNGPRCRLSSVTVGLGGSYQSHPGYSNHRDHTEAQVVIWADNGIVWRKSNKLVWNTSAVQDIVEPGGLIGTKWKTFTFSEIIWQEREEIFIGFISASKTNHEAATGEDAWDGYGSAQGLLKSDTWLATYGGHSKYFYGNPGSSQNSFPEIDSIINGYGSRQLRQTWFLTNGYPNGIPYSWYGNPPDIKDLYPNDISDVWVKSSLPMFYADADRYGVDLVEQGGVPLTASGMDEFQVGSFGTSAGVDIKDAYSFADIKIYPYIDTGMDWADSWVYPHHPNVILPL